MLLKPLDENWYDHTDRSYYCAVCRDKLECAGQTVKDHVVTQWTHQAAIYFPGKFATDSKGKTVEGVYAIEPHVARAVIPYQSAIRYCVECWPVKEPCCDSPLDPKDLPAEHSRVTTAHRCTDGVTRNLKHYIIHHDCLPAHFAVVREYVKKHGPR